MDFVRNGDILEIQKTNFPRNSNFITEALKYRHLNCVKYMLKNGFPHYDTNYLYDEIAKTGDVELLSIAFDVYPDTNKSAVIEACHRGDTKMIKSLLDRGFQRNKTAVFNALIGGNVKFAKFLISNGFYYGETSIIPAMRSGDLCLVEIFYNLSLRTEKGRNTKYLSIALTNPLFSQEVIDFLIDKNCEIPDTGISFVIKGSTKKENLIIKDIEFLISRNFKIDKLPTLTAYIAGHLTVLSWLLSNEFPIHENIPQEIVDKARVIITDVLTPFDISRIDTYSQEFVKRFDNRRDPAIVVYSAQHNNLYLLKTLVINRFPKVEDAVLEAIKRGNIRMIYFMIDNVFPLTIRSLEQAVIKGNTEILDILMNNKCPIPTREQLINTAVMNNDLNMVRCLFKWGITMSSNASEIAYRAENEEMCLLLSKLGFPSFRPEFKYKKTSKLLSLVLCESSVKE